MSRSRWRAPGRLPGNGADRSPSRGLAVDASVGSPTIKPRLRIDIDRVRVALACGLHDVSHALELVHRCRVTPLPLEAQAIREPLMMQPRRIDGVLNVHAEVNHVDNDLQRGVDNG